MNFTKIFGKEIKIDWKSKKTKRYIAAILVVVILVLAYFVFFTNNFSKDNILVQVLGSKQAANGEKVSWTVNVKNNSNVRIDNVNLIFEYPSGTFDDNGNVKKREEIKLDKVAGKTEESKTFSGVLFGKKNEQKEAKARIDYNPQGLSTEFENDAKFSTILSDSFIIFDMKTPDKVDPKEEFTVSLSWQSALSFPLTNMQLRLTLPKGFERTSEKLGEERQDLDTLSEQTNTGQSRIIFDLGALNEGEGNTIEIKGKLSGDTGQDKMFKAEFGRFDDNSYEFISLASTSKAVKIISSTINIFRKINGENEYIATPGEKLSYVVNFKNTGEDIYRNLTLTINLESNFLDFNTLKAQGGKIESLSATSKKITFPPENTPELLFLGPYDEGNVGFSVNVKNDIPSQNAFIKETVTIGTVSKTFQTKIASKTSFYQYSYYNLPVELQGKITAGGQFPLSKDKETIVVVRWRVTNRGNNLQNAKITGTLSGISTWTGVIYPSNAGFSFDNNTKTVTLNLGNVSYNFNQDYAFQVKVKPTEIPQDIITGSKFSAKDVWTGQGFEMLSPNLNTSSVE